MSETIKTFSSSEYGIEATIAAYYKGGFSVAIKDTDAGEFYPFAKVFPTMEAGRRLRREGGRLTCQ